MDQTKEISMNRYTITIRYSGHDVVSQFDAISDRHALRAAIAILDASEGGCYDGDVELVSIIAHISSQDKTFPAGSGM